MVKKITIGHLYPKQMNVYGDLGNVIALTYRLNKRGIEAEYIKIETAKDVARYKPDILIGGGGQDSNQEVIQSDFISAAEDVKQLVDDGLVVLLICGMYQMFGNRFVTADGLEIKGVGILELETQAGDKRLIGNSRIDSQFGELIGFENHSGKTYLGASVKPLGEVISGSGNNGEDGGEGVIFKNIFGTYMHGPVLPKNPKFADELILRALSRKYGASSLVELDDALEERAHFLASKRPR